MRLSFVHGMSQENKNPAALRKVWEDALTEAWAAADLPARKYTVEMPFYGDVLNNLIQQVRGKSQGVIARGGGAPGQFTALEEELIREMGADAGVSDDDVRAELGQEVVARGPANWEWVQGIARVLQRRVPALGTLGLGFVRQVDAYLTRPHIRAEVDDIVRPCLMGERTIVVAHSLGTIVTYRLLQGAKGACDVPLYVTLGSPLGIDVVKQHIRPPALGRPPGVRRWLNGTDERDYVALVGRLDRDNFAGGIENLSDIHNRRDDAHAIVDYLADPTVAQRIHAALA
jgi:hypothetical protein